MKDDKFEVRKVQITGGGSFIVSLPKRWAMERRLVRGDRVVFSDGGEGSLILSPMESFEKSGSSETMFTVHPLMEPESIIRRVVALYLIGFTVIRMKTTQDRFESLHSDYVKDFVRRKLVGTEVVSESPNELTLQVLISYPELSVDSALRRMVTVTVAMLRDAVSALATNDVFLAAEVLKMEDEVDRFGFYIVRQLKMASQSPSIMKHLGLSSGRDIIGYRLVTKSVERVADHAVKIAENVKAMRKETPQRLLRNIRELGEEATRFFEDSVRALYKRNYGDADEVLKRMNLFKSLEERVLKDMSGQKIDPIQMSFLRLIIESMRRVEEYGSDIAEVVLNLTAVSPEQ
ncbi:PhoU family transcriptional regulator [Candidatus Bathyarchaeota archaeon]|nr:PhoU family transcriptional regulator [Candidatus Bathyarchaeota archaeon]